jgi:hypothetical protein
MNHYHGTPITPVEALYELSGRHFCVSHVEPRDVARVHQIGQSVMLDNGAFSKWKRGAETDWTTYYEWCERWLAYPTTWAVIPDVIDGGSQVQDALLREWPFGHKGSPVWHMDESIDRLLELTESWPRVCIGSAAQFATVLSPTWERRTDDYWNEIARRGRFLPAIHMLRGMQCSGRRWPFASVDSTDVARNHNREQNAPGKMAARWDAMQTPGVWEFRAAQLELERC